MKSIATAKVTPPTEAAVDGTARPPSPVAPPLMLLVCDAAGPAVRRLHTFGDAESAAQFIRFWYPPLHRRGIIAFWALPQRPERALCHEPGEDEGDGATGEAAVLIRDGKDPGLVCPFSFMDMEAALAFLREEAQRGLDMALVQMYWAVPVTIESPQPELICFNPATPPVVRGLATATDGSTVEESPSSEAAPGPADVAPKAGRETERPSSEPTKLNELLGELATVLRVSRREPRREAFQGFGSPPGRF